MMNEGRWPKGKATFKEERLTREDIAKKVFVFVFVQPPAVFVFVLVIVHALRAIVNPQPTAAIVNPNQSRIKGKEFLDILRCYHLESGVGIGRLK